MLRKINCLFYSSAFPLQQREDLFLNGQIPTANSKWPTANGHQKNHCSLNAEIRRGAYDWKQFKWPDVAPKHSININCNLIMTFPCLKFSSWQNPFDRSFIIYSFFLFFSPYAVQFQWFHRRFFWWITTTSQFLFRTCFFFNDEEKSIHFKSICAHSHTKCYIFHSKI